MLSATSRSDQMRADYYSRMADILHGNVAGLVTVNEAASATEAISRLPEAVDRSDFIWLADVLARLPEQEVSKLLAALAKLGCRVLASISIRYSDVVLPDGTNEYKTVRSREWWEEEFQRHFPNSNLLPPYPDGDVAIANFAISPAVRSDIEKALAKSKLQSEGRRLRIRLLLLRRFLSRNLVFKQQLLAKLSRKRVAVVGNARSLDQTMRGAEIDGHDIVIRFNRAPIVAVASHGARTDWLATSVHVDGHRLVQLGVEQLLWMTPRHRKLNEDMLKVDQLYIHPIKDASSLAKRAKVDRPTTGLYIIDLLSKSDCRSVDLYGFDFYKSQSSSGHQTTENTPHSYNLEEVFVSNLIERDERFKICR